MLKSRHQTEASAACPTCSPGLAETLTGYDLTRACGHFSCDKTVTLALTAGKNRIEISLYFLPRKIAYSWFFCIFLSIALTIVRRKVWYTFCIWNIFNHLKVIFTFYCEFLCLFPHATYSFWLIYEVLIFYLFCHRTRKYCYLWIPTLLLIESIYFWESI